jgi:hypothetical protein
MIAEHPRGGLDGDVLKALRIQQPARHLGASDSVLGLDLRILRNIDFDTRLRIRPQQQTRKNKYPKKRIFQHIAISPAAVAQGKNIGDRAIALSLLAVSEVGVAKATLPRRNCTAVGNERARCFDERMRLASQSEALCTSSMPPLWPYREPSAAWHSVPGSASCAEWCPRSPRIAWLQTLGRRNGAAQRSRSLPV